MGVIVGIDLGTTYSLVATMREGRPVVLPNALGEILTPSAVSLDDEGRVLVGAAARARAITHAGRTALGFKRDMGTDRRVRLGPKELSAPELSALVLRALKEDAEAALGVTVDEAVVTVPAYFGDAQRQATRDAGEIAGLKIERIINEPTAAALAYGLHQRDREFRAVVLDLGGGTFDVSVLEIVEGVIEIQASAGDTHLGGDDFDAALADHVAARLVHALKKDHAFDPAGIDDVTRARLRDAAELAKKRLGAATETRVAMVDFPVGAKRVDVEITLTRAEAEEAWATCIARLDGPIRRALRDANLPAAKVDEILLVGGSTRMPCIAQHAARLFGRLPLRSLPPDEAVALGAAVQAALKSRDKSVEDMIVTDVAPFSLGIETSMVVGNTRVGGMFTPILERGTAIPASRMKTFSTMSDEQEFVQVVVYQGEHSECAKNVRLGEYRVPVPKGPRGQNLDVRFSYDLNGILEVETTLHANKKTSTLVLERTAGRLTKEEVEEARKAMARLKLHPRDALPNTTAIARAEGLHVELIGPARELLAAMIAGFRAALEGQDPKVIADARERLLATIDRLSGER